MAGKWAGLLGGLLVLLVQAGTAQGKPTDEQLAQLQAEIGQALDEHVLGCWFPASLDRENGGYHQHFDAAWQRRQAVPAKNLIGQTRLLWTASRASLLRPDQPALTDSARHGFRFLKERLWDGEHGGWYWSADARGVPEGPFGDEKHVYGQSFGIYACVAYYKASGDSQALDMAKQAFRLLEERAHDRRYGGYVESFTRDWTPRRQDESYSQRCPVSVWPGIKSMNSHIHLLEAFTELYTAWPDPVVAARVRELIDIICNKIQAGGALNSYFLEDWTVVPSAESYGHDVETTYLLMEAMSVTGAKDERIEKIAKKLTDHALGVGVDREEGGLYDLGDVMGATYSEEKIFWVQAEFLNTLLLLAAEYPEDSRNYYDEFVRQWTFIKDRMLDNENRGWRYQAQDPGDVRKGNKGGLWMVSYHTGRALMNCLEKLERMRSQQASSGKETQSASKEKAPAQSTNDESRVSYGIRRSP